MTRVISYQKALPFSTERLIEHYFDADAFDFIYQHLDLEAFKLEVLKADGRQHLRTVRITPALDLPWWTARALGAKRISYLETSSWDTNSATIQWSLLSSVLTEKIAINGEITLEPVDQSQSCLNFNAQISVSLFGVGSKVEAFIAEQLQNLQEMIYDLHIVYNIAQLRT